MFRNLRALLSHSRVPVRIAAQQDRNSLLYRVRFVPQDRRLYAFLRVFVVVTGIHVAANTTLQVFGGDWEEPWFIPLGFAVEQPQRRYDVEDPDFQAFLRFNQDAKKMSIARVKVLETLVKYLEKNNRAKFGGNVKAEGSILYYHYPQGPPPEYTRRGLQISPIPRDDTTSPTSILSPLRLSNLKYEWVTRPIPQPTMHRLTTTLYPTWVLNSLYTSLTNTFTWLTTLRDAGGPQLDSMSDLVAVGTTAIKQSLGDTHTILRSTWKPPPPPQGHVIISGVVQVSGNDLVVGIDVTASFDPETLGDLRFHKTQVRFAGKRKRRKQPVAPAPAPAPKMAIAEVPKEGIIAVLQAAAESQRREKSFVEKEAKGEDEAQGQGQEQGQGQGQQKAQEEEKGLVAMLDEKRGPTITDPEKVPPAGGKQQKPGVDVDVDDAAESKS